jgi:hypothetical protein
MVTREVPGLALVVVLIVSVTATGLLEVGFTETTS